MRMKPRSGASGSLLESASDVFKFTDLGQFRLTFASV